MFNRNVVLALALLALAESAIAEGAAEEIVRINEEIAVMSAKLSALEVRAKIAGKEQEISKLNTTSIGAPSELPVVRSIEGAGGRIFATLATGGGTTRTVVKGDSVGEWTVDKIDVNAVTLRRGKENIRLGFGMEPAITPSYPSVPVGMPPAGFPR
jgi:type IV pilus biogenesis protein PilP